MIVELGHYRHHKGSPHLYNLRGVRILKTVLDP